MRHLLCLLTLCAGTFHPIGADKAPTAAPKPATARTCAIPTDTAWHDVRKWGVEGRGWGDQKRKRWFDRLPAKAEGKVTPAVWNLSRDSAGMMVRLKTDTKAIYTRYTVTKTNLAMPHMPATGVSGLDLYARNDKGQRGWAQVARRVRAEVNAFGSSSGTIPGFELV